jgi:hypothetical protein
VAFESVTVVNTAANSLWVRIQDRAGNWSKWVEVIVGGDPYTDVANFNTLPTPTPTPSTNTGGGGGGGGGGSFGGGGFPITEPETTTASLSPKPETATATPTPTPSVTPEIKVTPSPSPTPSVSPSPSVTAQAVVTTRPDLVRPSAPAVSKSLGSGLSQVNKEIASTAAVVTTSAPASTLSKAPTLSASVGIPVRPLAKALPSKSTLTIYVVIGGKNIALGKVTTNSKGEVILPAISSSKPGTFTILMKTASGKSYYTKVKFSSKKK